MSAARVIIACLAVLVVAPVAGATSTKAKAPAHLHGFLLRADEPADASFERTPAFAWNPVPGAVSYQFQLATASSFRESAIVYSVKGLKTPVAAPTVTLPWVSDMLRARVRAVTSSSVTPWSTILNFDMEPTAVPTPISSYPGILRWTPIEGADGYEVWLVDAQKFETVYTNVLDEREFYTFHRTPNWMGSVRWRIRALRLDRAGDKRQNGLPAVGYGAWSPVYSSTNPSYSGGPINLVGTISDVVSTPAAPVAHELMPGFSFTGDQALDGTSAELFRVEVFTDRTCLNRVFAGSVVGGPGYAPRPYGPLALPTSAVAISAARASYLDDGDQPSAVTIDRRAVDSTESAEQAKPTTAVPDDSDADPGNETSATTSAPQQVTIDASADLGAPVDLWDTQDSGGYWWTVIPVEAVSPGALSTTLTAPAPAGATTVQVADGTGFVNGDIVSIGDPLNQDIVTVTSASGSTLTLATPLKAAHGVGEAVDRAGGAVQYRDLDLAQDACASGRVARFAKTSETTLAAAGELFASGLSPKGKLISATRKSSFYGSPLVAWTPAMGATVYEVQWSKTASPFRPEPDAQNGGARGTMTLGTAAVLPLTPGTWYYRVRGFNYSLPTNSQQMSWSNPAKIVVAKPQFKLVPGK
jgi:hypothetical protein